MKGSVDEDLRKRHSKCMTIMKKKVHHDAKMMAMRMRTKKVGSKQMMNTLGEECTHYNHRWK